MSAAAIPHLQDFVKTVPAHGEAVPREERAPEHVRALDGLRGVAVVMVVALHVFKANSQTPSRAVNLIYALIHSGWVGVDLFFVLSGFLITRILFSTLNDPRYLRNFYARRMLRIFPLYYGVLAVLVLVEPMGHLHLWRALPYYLSYTANLRPSGPIRFQDVPGNAWVISHFWSLQIEEQFYLIWPFTLALVRTRAGIVAAAIVGSAGALGLRCYFVVHAARFSNEYWAYAFTPCRVDSLLIGGALAMLWFSRAKPTLMRIAPWMFAACLLALAGDGIVRHEFEPIGDPFLLTIGFTLVALASASLIVLVLSRSGVRRIFEERGLCWLGKYSYGIYVLHFIWNYFLVDAVRHSVAKATHSKALAVGLSGLLVAGVSILTAYWSYELYEKRMLRLKRYFEYGASVPFGHGGSGSSDEGEVPSSAEALAVAVPVGGEFVVVGMELAPHPQ